MRFSVRLFDPQAGHVVRTTLVAANEADLRRAAEQRGLTLLAASQARPFSLRVWSIAAGRFDVGAWCTEMARLLRAGLSLPEALEAQALRFTDRGDTALVAVYCGLRDRLYEGKSLSEAMGLAARFPPMLIAAVKASERSGRVADALQEYSRHEGALRELKRRIVNASIYPLLVVSFGVLVSLFLLGYVVPRFSKVFADSNVKITHATGLILAIGDALNHHVWLVAAALTALAAGAVLAARDPRIRASAAALAVRIGPVARWVRELQLARITRAMAMLLGNGFTVPEAMRLSTALALRPDLNRAMEHATTAIETGRTTSAAWSESGIADAFAHRVLQAGERSGDLAACFESLAQAYQIEVETKLERASRVAEPLLLLIVAGLIGAIVVMMYGPIVDLATSVG
jgi:general secretion pathway protein F